MTRPPAHYNPDPMFGLRVDDPWKRWSAHGRAMAISIGAYYSPNAFTNIPPSTVMYEGDIIVFGIIPS